MHVVDLFVTRSNLDRGSISNNGSLGGLGCVVSKNLKMKLPDDTSLMCNQEFQVQRGRDLRPGIGCREPLSFSLWARSSVVAHPSITVNH